MQTFGYGGRTVKAYSIEEGLATCNALDRLDAAKAQREYDASINHGHDFGMIRRCECGIQEFDYKMLASEDRVGIGTRPMEYCKNYNK